jgi:hypothetical protein
MPETTFFAFLFYFPYFYHFTTNVTQPLPLDVIKGEAGIEREGETNKATTARTHCNRNRTPPPPKRLGTCSLSQKLVTPYYEHPGVR